MARCMTRYFGEMDYDESAVIEFPHGLPGFENRKRFLALEQNRQKPLVFLQNLEDPGLCFVTLPVGAVDPHYELRMTEADRELAGFESGREARLGEEAICLVILTITETGVTANLLAPVVINLLTRKAVQAIAPDMRYSHQTPVHPRESGAGSEESAC